MRLCLTLEYAGGRGWFVVNYYNLNLAQMKGLKCCDTVWNTCLLRA